MFYDESLDESLALLSHGALGDSALPFRFIVNPKATHHLHISLKSRWSMMHCAHRNFSTFTGQPCVCGSGKCDDNRYLGQVVLTDPKGFFHIVSKDKPDTEAEKLIAELQRSKALAINEKGNVSYLI